jgi:hypothetical protein
MEFNCYIATNIVGKIPGAFSCARHIYQKDSRPEMRYQLDACQIGGTNMERYLWHYLPHG